jgi:hypothetical protein
MITTPQDLLALRQEYKDYPEVYITTFPDGLSVAWKPLSWKRFQEIESYRRTVPDYLLEELIFKESVLDSHICLISDSLKAGVVSTISASVIASSGPVDPLKANLELMQERALLKSSLTNEIILLLCRAFPAYTPTDIENMTWTEIKKHLVQAEIILQQLGILKKPLKFEQIESDSAIKQHRKDMMKKRLERVPEKVIQDLSTKHKLPDNIKPGAIDFEAERREITAAMGFGSIHERDDILIEQEKLKRQAAEMYGIKLPDVPQKHTGPKKKSFKVLKK